MFSEEFWTGVLVSAIAFIFIHAWLLNLYKGLLASKGNSVDRTPEKLPDGNFYYIVPEPYYVKLELCRAREQQSLVDKITLSNSLSRTVDALRATVGILRTVPSVQNSNYRQLGIQANDAIQEGARVLSSAGNMLGVDIAEALKKAAA